MKAPDILERAAGHMRERAATYDQPEGERSIAQVVTIFNAYHGTQLSEAQGWHFMQILKNVRLLSSPAYHADSAEDGIAYAALMAEAMARDAAPAPAVAPAAAQPSDGWTRLPASRLAPVEVKTRRIDIRYRDGTVMASVRWNDGPMLWGYDPENPRPTDIVAYRFAHEPAAAAALDSSWITWQGGIHPPSIAALTLIDIRLRDGTQRQCIRMDTVPMLWIKSDSPKQIVAYRISSTQEAATR